MLDRRVFLAALAGAAAVRPAVAATASPYMDALNILHREGRYWPLYEQALANERAGGGEMAGFGVLDQVWAILGEERRARAQRAKVEARLAAERAAHPENALPPPTPFELDGAEDALDAIAAQARGRRVVILNEDHSLSRNRAFAAALAIRLRAEGFDWFAAEGINRAFAPGDPISPRLGYYVKDPVYAELLRVVRDLGYRTATYEMGTEPAAPASDRPEAKQRDFVQAANLIANVLDKDPASRVLVYAGHGHGREIPDPDGYRALGAWLHELAGIDPLTINQSIGVPELTPEQDPLALAAVLKRYRPHAPVAARLVGGGWLTGSAPGRMDMGVFFPRLADVEGRPGWLAQAPQRRKARWLMSGPLAAEGFLQAVPEAEAALGPAVPSDQMRLEPGSKAAVFFLRPGRYRVRLENAAGQLELGTLSV